MAYTAAPSATPVVRRKPGAANPTEAPPFGEGAMYRTSVPLIYKNGGCISVAAHARGSEEGGKRVPERCTQQRRRTPPLERRLTRPAETWAYKMGAQDGVLGRAMDPSAASAASIFRLEGLMCEILSELRYLYSPAIAPL